MVGDAEFAAIQTAFLEALAQIEEYQIYRRFIAGEGSAGEFAKVWQEVNPDQINGMRERLIAGLNSPELALDRAQIDALSAQAPQVPPKPQLAQQLAEHVFARVKAIKAEIREPLTGQETEDKLETRHEKLLALQAELDELSTQTELLFKEVIPAAGLENATAVNAFIADDDLDLSEVRPPSPGRVIALLPHFEQQMEQVQGKAEKLTAKVDSLKAELDSFSTLDADERKLTAKQAELDERQRALQLGQQQQAEEAQRQATADLARQVQDSLRAAQALGIQIGTDLSQSATAIPNLKEQLASALDGVGRDGRAKVAELQTIGEQLDAQTGDKAELQATKGRLETEIGAYGVWARAAQALHASMPDADSVIAPGAVSTTADPETLAAFKQLQTGERALEEKFRALAEKKAQREECDRELEGARRQLADTQAQEADIQMQNHIYQQAAEQWDDRVGLTKYSVDIALEDVQLAKEQRIVDHLAALLPDYAQQLQGIVTQATTITTENTGAAADAEQTVPVLEYMEQLSSVADCEALRADIEAKRAAVLSELDDLAPAAYDDITSPIRRTATPRREAAADAGSSDPRRQLFSDEAGSVDEIELPDDATISGPEAVRGLLEFDEVAARSGVTDSPAKQALQERLLSPVTDRIRAALPADSPKLADLSPTKRVFGQLSGAINALFSAQLATLAEKQEQIAQKDAAAQAEFLAAARTFAAVLAPYRREELDSIRSAMDEGSELSTALATFLQASASVFEPTQPGIIGTAKGILLAIGFHGEEEEEELAPMPTDTKANWDAFVTGLTQTFLREQEMQLQREDEAEAAVGDTLADELDLPDVVDEGIAEHFEEQRRLREAVEALEAYTARGVRYGPAASEAHEALQKTLKADLTEMDTRALGEQFTGFLSAFTDITTHYTDTILEEKRAEASKLKREIKSLQHKAPQIADPLGQLLPTLKGCSKKIDLADKEIKKLKRQHENGIKRFLQRVERLTIDANSFSDALAEKTPAAPEIPYPDEAEAFIDARNEYLHGCATYLRAEPMMLNAKLIELESAMQALQAFQADTIAEGTTTAADTAEGAAGAALQRFNTMHSALPGIVGAGRSLQGASTAIDQQLPVRKQVIAQAQGLAAEQFGRLSAIKEGLFETTKIDAIVTTFRDVELPTAFPGIREQHEAALQQLKALEAQLTDARAKVLILKDTANFDKFLAADDIPDFAGDADVTTAQIEELEAAIEAAKEELDRILLEKQRELRQTPAEVAEAEAPAVSRRAGDTIRKHAPAQAAEKLAQLEGEAATWDAFVAASSEAAEEFRDCEPELYTTAGLNEKLSLPDLAGRLREFSELKVTKGPDWIHDAPDRGQIDRQVGATQIRAIDVTSLRTRIDRLPQADRDALLPQLDDIAVNLTAKAEQLDADEASVAAHTHEVTQRVKNAATELWLQAAEQVEAKTEAAQAYKTPPEFTEHRAEVFKMLGIELGPEGSTDLPEFDADKHAAIFQLGEPATDISGPELLEAHRQVLKNLGEVTSAICGSAKIEIEQTQFPEKYDDYITAVRDLWAGLTQAQKTQDQAAADAAEAAEQLEAEIAETELNIDGVDGSIEASTEFLETLARTQAELAQELKVEKPTGLDAKLKAYLAALTEANDYNDVCTSEELETLGKLEANIADLKEANAGNAKAIARLEVLEGRIAKQKAFLETGFPDKIAEISALHLGDMDAYLGVKVGEVQPIEALIKTVKLVTYRDVSEKLDVDLKPLSHTEFSQAREQYIGFYQEYEKTVAHLEAKRGILEAARTQLEALQTGDADYSKKPEIDALLGRVNEALKALDIEAQRLEAKAKPRLEVFANEQLRLNTELKALLIEGGQVRPGILANADVIAQRFREQQVILGGARTPDAVKAELQRTYDAAVAELEGLKGDLQQYSNQRDVIKGSGDDKLAEVADQLPAGLLEQVRAEHDTICEAIDAIAAAIDARKPELAQALAEKQQAVNDDWPEPIENAEAIPVPEPEDLPQPLVPEQPPEDEVVAADAVTPPPVAVKPAPKPKPAPAAPPNWEPYAQASLRAAQAITRQTQEPVATTLKSLDLVENLTLADAVPAAAEKAQALADLQEAAKAWQAKGPDRRTDYTRDAAAVAIAETNSHTHFLGEVGLAKMQIEDAITGAQTALAENFKARAEKTVGMWKTTTAEIADKTQRIRASIAELRDKPAQIETANATALKDHRTYFKSQIEDLKDDDGNLKPLADIGYDWSHDFPDEDTGERTSLKGEVLNRHYAAAKAHLATVVAEPAAIKGHADEAARELLAENADFGTAYNAHMDAAKALWQALQDVQQAIQDRQAALDAEAAAAGAVTPPPAAVELAATPKQTADVVALAEFAAEGRQRVDYLEAHGKYYDGSIAAGLGELSPEALIQLALGLEAEKVDEREHRIFADRSSEATIFNMRRNNALHVIDTALGYQNLPSTLAKEVAEHRAAIDADIVTIRDYHLPDQVWDKILPHLLRKGKLVLEVADKVNTDVLKYVGHVRDVDLSKLSTDQVNGHLDRVARAKADCETQLKALADARTGLQLDSVSEAAPDWHKATIKDELVQHFDAYPLNLNERIKELEKLERDLNNRAAALDAHGQRLNLDLVAARAYVHAAEVAYKDAIEDLSHKGIAFSTRLIGWADSKKAAIYYSSGQFVYTVPEITAHWQTKPDNFVQNADLLRDFARTIGFDAEERAFADLARQVDAFSKEVVRVQTGNLRAVDAAIDNEVILFGSDIADLQKERKDYEGDIVDLDADALAKLSEDHFFENAVDQLGLLADYYNFTGFPRITSYAEMETALAQPFKSAQCKLQEHDGKIAILDDVLKAFQTLQADPGLAADDPERRAILDRRAEFEQRRGGLVAERDAMIDQTEEHYKMLQGLIQTHAHADVVAAREQAAREKRAITALIKLKGTEHKPDVTRRSEKTNAAVITDEAGRFGAKAQFAVKGKPAEGRALFQMEFLIDRDGLQRFDAAESKALLDPQGQGLARTSTSGYTYHLKAEEVSKNRFQVTATVFDDDLMEIEGETVDEYTQRVMAVGVEIAASIIVHHTEVTFFGDNVAVVAAGIAFIEQMNAKLLKDDPHHAPQIKIHIQTTADDETPVALAKFKQNHQDKMKLAREFQKDIEAEIQPAAVSGKAEATDMDVEGAGAGAPRVGLASTMLFRKVIEVGERTQAQEAEAAQVSQEFRR